MEIFFLSNKDVIDLRNLFFAFLFFLGILFLGKKAARVMSDDWQMQCLIITQKKAGPPPLCAKRCVGILSFVSQFVLPTTITTD